MDTSARTVAGNAERSPFVNVTSGERFSVRFGRPVAFELDGGDRADQAAEGRSRAQGDHGLRAQEPAP
jgi:hypothetical protein